MASPTATDDAIAPVKVDLAGRLVFRSSFPVLWRWTSTMCGLLGAGIYLFSMFLGRPVSAPPTIGLAILISTMFAAAALLFPVYVLPKGIRCYDFFGFYQTIDWDEMGDMKVSSMLGLKYLVVNRVKKPDQIWIPLYLYDAAGFKAAVRERAGKGHALLEALERYS